MSAYGKSRFLITRLILPNPFLYVMSVASSEANHFRIVLSFCLVSVVSEICLHFCAKSCSLAQNNCSQPNFGSISTVDIDMRGSYKHKMARVMSKPDFCICENKDTDHLHGNRAADQLLCFRYIDSINPLLPKSEISSLPTYVQFVSNLIENPKDRFSHSSNKKLFR